MDHWKLNDGLIEYLATGLLVLATSLWMFWGVDGIYREGWWDAWYYRALYLLPGILCLGLILLALSRSRIGAWLLVTIGGAFTGWWWWYISATVGLTPERLLITFPVSGILVVAGVLFLIERHRTQSRSETPSPSDKWLYRNMRYLIAIGFPLLVAAVSSTVIPLTEPHRAIITAVEPEGYSENDQFRNLSVQFVRTVAEDYFAERQTQPPGELSIKGNWDLEIAIYHSGEIKGSGEYKATDEALSLALEEATRNALDAGNQGLNEEALDDMRFRVNFTHSGSFSGQVDMLFSLLPFHNYNRNQSLSEYNQLYSFIAVSYTHLTLPTTPYV